MITEINLISENVKADVDVWPVVGGVGIGINYLGYMRWLKLFIKPETAIALHDALTKWRETQK